MENYVNRGSARTPAIHFDTAKGILEIKGRSIPENSIEFYKPLNEFISNYILLEKPHTTVNVFFDYFNTNSMKCVFDVFKKLEILAIKGHSVIINWIYEEGDDDMLEFGLDFQSVLKIPFTMKEFAAKPSI